MRTVKFIEVFNGVVDLWGINPLKEVPPDLARSIVRKINNRVNRIVKTWDWPEWTVTEQRAFRPIWNDGDQYLRVSTLDGQPDEVFYLPTKLYYRVNADWDADPPVGTPPGGNDYWTLLDTIDPFIAYDQRCRRSIGTVNGVFQQSPRMYRSQLGLKYHPSSRGIDVLNAGTPTVYIEYQMPVPSYTIVPYVVGRTYQRSDVVFDPTIGECFQALATTTAIPADTFFWRRIPFPAKWYNAIIYGAFADSLLEYNQGGNTEFPVRQQMALSANVESDEALDLEVNALQAQGQVLKYAFCQGGNGYWCASQPWTGGDVTDLSDACEDDLGFVYPAPPQTPSVSWQYYNTVRSLRTTPVAFNTIPTRLLLPDSIAQIKIVQQGEQTLMTWTLMAGTANASKPNGQVAPLDYDSSNAKYWLKLE